ncbi:MAG: IS3 family transposase [Gemmatimonadetes bacterium]|nr:IS3 family transposase [Gemmatimonadota bacterium]
MHDALQNQGVRGGRDRVARLMQQAGLRARKSRRRVRATTDSRHAHPVAPNRLHRNFTANRPNGKWVADITYVPTREGWLYLAVVMDLYARKVVGWAMNSRMKEDLTKAALDMALRQRCPTDRLLHHSDRGRQYASRGYRRLLLHHRVRRSMSRKGNCWDNAPMESFMATLKTELIHHQDFHTLQEARQAIFEYIEVFYNRQRSHSALGYNTPVQYEQNFEPSIIVH